MRGGAGRPAARPPRPRPCPGGAGYLDGRALAEVFAWLRPGDLVWNYWVNNYLLGKKPPAFDILFWNADTTRMTAGAARRLRRPGHGQPARRAGRGSPCSACRSTCRRVDVDTYVVAGIADHITPVAELLPQHRSCSAATTRFVLSTSGHIAALVNPPGNPKASYQVNTDNPADAGRVAAQSAETEQGSWWPDFVGLAGRALRRANAAHRSKLGGGGLPPLVDAPGTYVFDS